MLSHYSEHRVEEGDDFLEFLRDHYFDVDGHDHEGQNPHEKLPFQNQSITPISIFQYIPVNINISLEKIIGFDITIIGDYYQDVVSFQFSKKILQPPKL